MKPYLFIFLLGCHCQALAISPFTAEYDIAKGVVKVGEMTRLLSIDEDQGYVFESRMKTTGLVSLFSNKQIIEISRGTLRDARLRPHHYSYVKQSKKKDYTLAFDHDNGLVMRNDTPNGWQAALPVGVLDKLSYQAQMMLDVAAEPARLEYLIASRRELETYQIINLGRAEIDISLGRFSTVVLERRKSESKRRTTVWLAEALGWIPVKVEYVEKDGSLMTATLRRLLTPGANAQ